MSSEFNLCNYEYGVIVGEMRPIMERYFRREDLNVGVFDLKLIDRSNNIANFLVITTNFQLWTFQFEFSHPDRWEHHELQSSCHPIVQNELEGVRRNFIEIQGMSEIQANAACMKFFSEATTCLEKEEKARLRQQISDEDCKKHQK